MDTRNVGEAVPVNTRSVGAAVVECCARCVAPVVRSAAD
jgi:hypothetical protein